jgi:hypothetical protein
MILDLLWCGGGDCSDIKFVMVAGVMTMVILNLLWW